MATKRTTTKTKTTTPRTPRTIAQPAATATVKVRMYRQGLGDCFLLTLPRENGVPYYIMIDCGVILGTSDATTIMQDVVADIIMTTGGHIDLLLATHEHWDHLSGFVQARESFTKLQVDQVWLGWTEDPADPRAQKLHAEHQGLRLALSSACARMHLGGTGETNIDGLLEFFGAAGQGTTSDALEFVRELGRKEKPHYCKPTDAPVMLEGTGARLYVLGPPLDEQAIRRTNPSKADPETYGMAVAYLQGVTSAITQDDANAPFDPIWQIPLNVAEQMPFFQHAYWGENAEADAQKDQSWRRIDSDWLAISSDLALQLDNATNNTSLVVALELADGRVLLFAADAQVGNWLSWQDLSWTFDGKTVTGPELMQRTVFYKAGHHGSHNASLREKGVELMRNLQIACIPVDHEMALKKRWGKIPLGELEQRLIEITKGGVLRIDQDIPETLAKSVEQDPEKKLYYEVSI